MSTLKSMLTRVSTMLSTWWERNGSEVLGSMETHKLIWIYGLSFVSLVSIFVLGGALIKNGVIFGILMTASLVMLFLHGGKESQEKRTRALLWLSRHTGLADSTIWIGCAILTITAGVTTGIAMSVVCIFTSLLLHTLKGWGAKQAI